MNRRVFIFSACVALLVGCGSDDGQSFIGHWANVKSPDGMPLIIDKNGASFLVTVTTFGQTSQFPAVFKDGLLQVQVPGKTLSMSIKEKTGTLVGGPVEYKRIEK